MLSWQVLMGSPSLLDDLGRFVVGIQPDALRARPPALASSSSRPSLVLDSKNAAAGPSKPPAVPVNPKIDRHQAQRHRVEHAGSTLARPSAKRNNVTDLEADDEDDDAGAEDPIQEHDELDSPNPSPRSPQDVVHHL